MWSNRLPENFDISGDVIRASLRGISENDFDLAS